MYFVAREQIFSRSLLWDLQQQYFALRGVAAWSRGEVPHYITSNPTIANSYAEIVFAFLRDQGSLASAGEFTGEPLHICELGGGSGRFTFHFLCRLARLCEQAGVALASFRYVLTDKAENNLAFWRGHPRFQPFLAEGFLDLAAFDVNDSDKISLQLSGRTIGVGDLKRPLVVIANYVFDSVPQDLFYIDSGGCQECMVSLMVDVDPASLDFAELLGRVRCHFDRRPLTAPAYEEAWLQQLMAGYQRALTDSYLLFPAAGLRCLQRLKALSEQGLLLLSADKGDHRLAALQGMQEPVLVHHGSFSLSVNYHAIKEFCERNGGLAMFPVSRHSSLNVSACLMVDGAAGYLETRRAYERHVREFSPDDFFTIAHHALRGIDEMSLEEILAYLRLSRYDSRPFGWFLPRLTELAAGLDRDERRAVSDTIDRVWDLYFPLGESLDLANAISCLLYEMKDYRRALDFCARSLEIYQPDAGTLTNMAACHHRLGENEKAKALLRAALEQDPEDAPARKFLAAIGSP